MHLLPRFVHSSDFLELNMAGTPQESHFHRILRAGGLWIHHKNSCSAIAIACLDQGVLLLECLRKINKVLSRGEKGIKLQKGSSFMSQSLTSTHIQKKKKKLFNKSYSKLNKKES